MSQLVIASSEVELSLDLLPELEDRVERGLANFVDVGDALKVIQDGKLWRGQYDSFADYCHDRWGLKRSSSYAYITAASVAHSLELLQNLGQLPYSKALQLVTLSEDQRVEVARDHDLITMPHHEIKKVVQQVIATEKRRPPKIRSTPPRGTAIIRTLDDLLPECADLLILSTPSSPPVLTEIGQYLRPGCSLLVPFQMPMILMTADPSVRMLGIIGVARPQRGDSGPLIIEQDLYGWFSRGDYVGGRCSNRLQSLADVVGVVSYAGDTVVHLGAADRSVLDATVLSDRHYIAVHPSDEVAEAISRFTN